MDVENQINQDMILLKRLPPHRIQPLESYRLRQPIIDTPRG
jgi:hypothetical protein